MKFTIFVCFLGVLSSVVSEDVNGWTYANQINLEAPCGAPGQQLCGPNNWYQVSSQCNGLTQSPIDLSQDLSTIIHEPFPTYSDNRCKNWVQESSKDALEIYLETCNFQSAYQGKLYKLDHIHFHSPSEHTLDGEHLDAEAHLVHIACDGDLLVQSVLLTASGAPNNAFLDQVWLAGGENICTGQRTHASCAVGINPYYSLVPSERSFFAYTGSLTTPTCYPGVPWIVFRTPVFISMNDLDLIRAAARARRDTIVDQDGDNKRPVQQRNGCTVYLVTPAPHYQPAADTAKYIRVGYV